MLGPSEHIPPRPLYTCRVCGIAYSTLAKLTPLVPMPRRPPPERSAR